MKFYLFVLMLTLNIYCAEHLVLNNEIYNQVPNDIVRLQGDANEVFMKGYKAFFQQITYQNVPGVKEVSMGYYYDNPTKKLKGVFFTKFDGSYPKKTGRFFDFAIAGDGFFVLRLPNGEEAYTRDGRFDLDQQNTLVSFTDALPILGQNGPIKIEPSSQVHIDGVGNIIQDGVIMDRIKIIDFEQKLNLSSLNPSIFVMSEFLEQDKRRLKEPSYELMQGYIEDNSMVKAMAGQMDEYIFGQDANARILKHYSKNISLSIQSANP